MQDIYRIANTDAGLSLEEIRVALLESLQGRQLRKVLILPPDFTRFHSGAGFITNVYYHALAEQGVQVDVSPGLGARVHVTKEQGGGVCGGVRDGRVPVRK